MIAASDFSGNSGLRILNDNTPAGAPPTGGPASFAQALGCLLQALPKAKTASNAAFMHAALGKQDPEPLQAEIGTLFGAVSSPKP